MLSDLHWGLGETHISMRLKSGLKATEVSRRHKNKTNRKQKKAKPHMTRPLQILNYLPILKGFILRNYYGVEKLILTIIVSLSKM